MASKSKDLTSGNLEKIIGAIFTILYFYLLGVFSGILYLPWKNPFLYLGILIWAIIINIIATYGLHLDLLLWAVPEITDTGIVNWIRELGYVTNLYILLIVPITLFILMWGVLAKSIKKKAQSDFDMASIKNPKGELAIVVKINDIDEFQKEIVINAPAVSHKEIWDKKENLETVYDMPLVDIVSNLKNKKIMALKFSNKKITGHYPFVDELTDNLGSYEFIIGKDINGIVKQKLCDLPHMMISGATLSGKSNFFHLTLYQLLKVNRRTRLYFLDLKKGVEARPYKILPNVKTASTEEISLHLLEEIHKEMMLRLVYLEKMDIEKLNPKTSGLDLILVAIDEASVLFGKTTAKDKRREVVEKSRALSDDITKLGRAASIHMIIATQKVIKETVDTRVQENIAGRMCFKTETTVNSMMVLNNTLAYHLPFIKGRAIWKVGPISTEVQAPLFDRNCIKEKFKILKEDLKDENYQSVGMLILNQNNKKTEGTSKYEQKILPVEKLQ